MKIIKLSSIFIVICFLVVGCKNSSTDQVSENIISNLETQDEVMIDEISFLINNKEYKVKLEDSDTVSELLMALPESLDFNQLNGNEYYSYLNTNIITDPTNIQKIEDGDVMLYGSNCLVIFYKSFNTSYSYTRIGKISDTKDLEENLAINSQIEIIK